MLKTTVCCSDCGETLTVSTYKPTINNLGDLVEVFAYVEPCRCGSESTTNDAGSDDVPVDCEYCGETVSLESVGLGSDGKSLVCNVCEVTK